jgi:3-deoxy-7-phosphoheptulonate synthase
MNTTQRVISVNGVALGGPEIALMAGPCAVESSEQIQACAAAAASAGGTFLRGGGFKTRTSPRSFQGLGLEGVRLLREAADLHGLRTVSEVLDASQLEAAAPWLDLVQIGSRNMQNVTLLREVGRSGLPVLLKRGFGATIDEWLLAAEYVLAEGNDRVVLCERGIRTFETATRFTLDLAAVPVAKARTGLPVVIDPSHPAGRRELVAPLALAAIAAGADGLLVEIHPQPSGARSDPDQALSFDAWQDLVRRGRAVAEAVGRRLGSGAE